MTATTNPKKTPVVLLVDDNAINLQMLHQTLEGQGYRLLAARSGEAALKIAQKEMPDLILLDIMMPGIDGYETCARLKSNESTRNAVVIFLSALQSTEEKVRGLSLGAMDFITKPFDPDEVLARVSTQLAAHQKHKDLLAQNQRLADELTRSLQSGSGVAASRAEWIKALIETGETDRVELKSTLRWNLKTDRADKAIEKSWLKTVVAFLNSDGGVLLVGVANDGEILGPEVDGFENEDKYLLHVNNKIRQHIGPEFAAFIRFQLTRLDEKKVLIIECQPSLSPVFLKMGNDEDFFIRIGPGSRRLTTSEVLAYASNRRLPKPRD
jgi:DNA-binding response OmpR family regulator